MGSEVVKAVLRVPFTSQLTECTGGQARGPYPAVPCCLTSLPQFPHLCLRGLTSLPHKLVIANEVISEEL